jgi:hypothetical protein
MPASTHWQHFSHCGELSSPVPSHLTFPTAPGASSSSSSPSSCCSACRRCRRVSATFAWTKCRYTTARVSQARSSLAWVGGTVRAVRTCSGRPNERVHSSCTVYSGAACSKPPKPVRGNATWNQDQCQIVCNLLQGEQLCACEVGLGERLACIGVDRVWSLVCGCLLLTTAVALAPVLDIWVQLVARCSWTVYPRRAVPRALIVVGLVLARMYPPSRVSVWENTEFKRERERCLGEFEGSQNLDGEWKNARIPQKRGEINTLLSHLCCSSALLSSSFSHRQPASKGAARRRASGSHQ